MIDPGFDRNEATGRDAGGEAGDGVPPGWVEGLLLASPPPSPEFNSRIKAAGRRAWLLARLRRQAGASGGWYPQAVPDYLFTLAASAGVQPAEALAAASLPDDFPAGPESATAWGWLARRLGLRDREAVLSYRLAVAREAGLEIPWLAVAARANGPGRPSTVEDWDRASALALADVPEVAALLRKAECLIRDEYGRGDGDAPREGRP
jgi:hypothetical protein